MHDSRNPTRTTSRIASRRWFLSKHALERAGEMGLTRADVVRVLNSPDVTYPAGDGRTMSIRNRVAVCSAREVVVTVLWHTADRTADRNPAHLVAATA